jgi:hypothetical protein
MSFCENKKNILNSREAFLRFRIVDCGSKSSCSQDKGPSTNDVTVLEGGVRDL